MTAPKQYTLDIVPDITPGVWRMMLGDKDITEKVVIAEATVYADGDAEMFLQFIRDSVPDNCVVRFTPGHKSSNGASHG